MASQKSGSDARKVRVPEAVDGIQVNHCKNPVCENFGLAARSKGKDPGYTRVGANSRPPRIGEQAKSIPPSVRYKACGETIPLKSNAGVVDTIDILTWRPETFCCPRPECENTSVDLRTTPEAYYRHGKTRQGTPRFRCRACGQTFVTQARRRPPRAGERPYRTEQVVKALLNSMPIKRIIEMFSIRPQTVYDIIDRAYEACLVFAAERETQLGAKTAGRGAIHIATDRQSYTLNWRLRADKRNTVLRAIVSTEVLSGYVFPVHLNYDARSDVTQVNEMAMLLGDPTDSVGTEVNAQQMWQMFPDEYLNASGAVECLGHKLFDAEDCQGIRLRVKTARGEETWDGVGNGPIDATLKALGADVRVQNYDEHSMGTGSDARAVTFVELAAEGLHGDVFGVGIDPNIITASVRAIVSGINRVCRHRQEVLPGAL